jgi:hypothetical protein
MIISGFTDSRLSEVKTYDANNPYQVGYKGVTSITADINGNITLVEYTIDGIDYVTSIGQPLFPNSDLYFKTQTVYYFNSSGLTQNDINVIKKEAEMGISEKPKIESDIFIERQSTSIFEKFLRLDEIGNLEELVDYGNGYYKIFKID